MNSEKPIASRPKIQRKVRREGRHKRSLKRRVKKKVRRGLFLFAMFFLPTLYRWYMAFVIKTSKVEVRGYTPHYHRSEGRGCVYALWHEESFLTLYQLAKWKGYVLVSQSDFGDFVDRVVKPLGSGTIMGGGSQTDGVRQIQTLVDELVETMKSDEGVAYAIACDGSTGPAFRMKRGAVRTAIGARVPVGICRSWMKRYFRIPTWDRTMIPLPFNKILFLYQGPFEPPEPEEGPRAEKRFRDRVEKELCRLSGYAHRQFEGEPTEEWLSRFPEVHREALMDTSEPQLFNHPEDAEKEL